MARTEVLRVGTAGWSIPRSAAELFPGEGSHLQRYAEQLRCAEINSSFYRPPRSSTWTRWAESVPAGFQFSVKAPKTMTHGGKLGCEAEVLESFLAGAQLLGASLGPLLFQLPPKLEFDSAQAETFLRMLRRVHQPPVALEPRHASWFTTEVAGMLASWQVARVATDPARVPEAAVAGGYEGLVYYRLHGSPRTYYSRYEPEYLEALAKQAQAHRRTGASVWVIFDNTASGAAAHNALECNARLQCNAGEVRRGG